VQNFNRDGNGNWRQAGGYTSNINAPQFRASLRRDGGVFSFEFEWAGLGGGWMDKPDAYDSLDVSVSIANESGKRIILSNIAVPVDVSVLVPQLRK